MPIKIYQYLRGTVSANPVQRPLTTRLKSVVRHVHKPVTHKLFGLVVLCDNKKYVYYQTDLAYRFTNYFHMILVWAVSFTGMRGQTTYIEIFICNYDKAKNVNTVVPR